MANYKQEDYDPSTHGYWKGTIDGAPNFGYPGNYQHINHQQTYAYQKNRLPVSGQ